MSASDYALYVLREAEKDKHAYERQKAVREAMAVSGEVSVKDVQ